jgi:hypothetical protein
MLGGIPPSGRRELCSIGVAHLWRFTRVAMSATALVISSAPGGPLPLHGLM